MPSADVSDGSPAKRKLSQTDFETTSGSKPRKKPIACKPCHARKIKCSFEQPCNHCQQSKNPEACVYPTRDHKVTVAQSYIDKLVSENQRLREGSQNEDAVAIGPVDATKETSPVLEASEARNPLLDDGSWFFPLGTSGPILISEAADAAFATRLRQTLATDGIANHIPRVEFISDAKLIGLAEIDLGWPSLARARLLVKTAFDTVGSCYHCVRKSEVFNGLKKHYRNPTTRRSIFACKLEALFALGEAYSCRTQATSEDSFPGLAYFARASRTLRGVRERPQVEWIEVLLLLVSSMTKTDPFFAERHSSHCIPCYSTEDTVRITLRVLPSEHALLLVCIKTYPNLSYQTGLLESTA